MFLIFIRILALHGHSKCKVLHKHLQTTSTNPNPKSTKFLFFFLSFPLIFLGHSSDALVILHTQCFSSSQQCSVEEGIKLESFFFI